MWVLCLNYWTRDEAVEKTDAGRVAPISACVFYQIDKLKSGFEAMGRTVLPGNCALMGATRLASGKMQCSYTKQKLTDSTNYTPICESFALITERGTRLLSKPTRDASPPLVLAFDAWGFAWLRFAGQQYGWIYYAEKHWRVIRITQKRIRSLFD